MNDTAINEFKKLTKQIQHEINTNNENRTINIYRLKQIKNVINILKNYPKKITFESLKEIEQFVGIGKSTIRRIKEILETGSLSELTTFTENEEETEHENIINELQTVVGIGRSTAIHFIRLGVKSINDLKKKIKNKDIQVTEKIKIGLKYHGKFFDKIPRNEIDKIKKILNNIIDKFNKENNLSSNDKYIIEICGSYRREKLLCNDIDILLTQKNLNSYNFDHLNNFVKLLKEPLKLNNNKPFIIDDITYKTHKTKYMGFCKYKNNLCRRIDIRFVLWKSFYTALLYFTGSAEHNQKMRQIAKKKGYKLSEYKLYDIKNNVDIPIDSEKKIFNILGISYIEPHLRE
jgi:DNA polymerase/3'-5' exonuclease PolX